MQRQLSIVLLEPPNQDNNKLKSTSQGNLCIEEESVKESSKKERKPEEIVI
jgi:hypothetical protein